MDGDTSRLKQLELLGGIGAGILGAGAALLFAKWLVPYAVPVLVAGLMTHGRAMYAKARLERKAHEARPWWATAAEWVCWIMIAALIFYIAWSRIS